MEFFTIYNNNKPYKQGNFGSLAGSVTKCACYGEVIQRPQSCFLWTPVDKQNVLLMWTVNVDCTNNLIGFYNQWKISKLGFVPAAYVLFERCPLGHVDRTATNYKVLLRKLFAIQWIIRTYPFCLQQADITDLWIWFCSCSYRFKSMLGFQLYQSNVCPKEFLFRTTCRPLNFENRIMVQEGTNSQFWVR